jgi:hypothetical protein
MSILHTDKHCFDARAESEAGLPVQLQLGGKGHTTHIRGHSKPDCVHARPLAIRVKTVC